MRLPYFGNRNGRALSERPKARPALCAYVDVWPMVWDGFYVGVPPVIGAGRL